MIAPPDWPMARKTSAACLFIKGYDVRMTAAGLKNILRSVLPPPAYRRVAAVYRAARWGTDPVGEIPPTQAVAPAEPAALSPSSEAPSSEAPSSEAPSLPPPNPAAREPRIISIEEKRRMAAENFWHYEHDLGDGVLTKPWWDWLPYWHGVRRQAIFERVHEYFGPSLAGLRCMDVACNSGFWSFELIDRGADSVFAFDVTEYLVKDAFFVRDCRNDRPEYQRIEFHVADYNNIDIPQSGFDLVLALGMMYHLTDVFGVAKRLAQATGRLAIIDSSVSDMPGDVLEIPPDGKYFWISKGEFSFVPTRAALRRIFEETGFSRVTPWMPDENHPCYKEYGPNGFRHILVCEK